MTTAKQRIVVLDDRGISTFTTIPPSSFWDRICFRYGVGKLRRSFLENFRKERRLLNDKIRNINIFFFLKNEGFVVVRIKVSEFVRKFFFLSCFACTTGNRLRMIIRDYFEERKM